MSIIRRIDIKETSYIIVLAEQAYFVQHSRLGWVEQDPDEILAKVGTNTVCGAAARIPRGKGKGRGDTVKGSRKES